MQKLEGEAFGSLLERGMGTSFVEALASSLHQLHSVSVENLGLNMQRRNFKDEVSELKTTSALLLAFSVAPVIFQRAYRTLSAISDLCVEGNPPALLHGDCGPDNVIYSSGVVYLIDLESAYIGDPACDLGYAYHCIRFATPSNPELAEDFIKAYEKLHGKISDLETHKRLASLKLAVLSRFLTGINPLSLVLLGPRRAAGLLAVRNYFSRFVDYCLEYAEKGRAELEQKQSGPKA